MNAGGGNSGLSSHLLPTGLTTFPDSDGLETRVGDDSLSEGAQSTDLPDSSVPYVSVL
jgi:hypothetical protein